MDDNTLTAILVVGILVMVMTIFLAAILVPDPRPREPRLSEPPKFKYTRTYKPSPDLTPAQRAEVDRFGIHDEDKPA